MTMAILLECKAPSTPPDLALVQRNVSAPTARQVQIEVSATAVNPIDVKRAAGYGRRLLGLKGAGRFPVALGNDVVGRVVAVGPAVTTIRVGDRVMGALPTGPQGAHASHVNVEENLVAPLVEGYTDDELAALPYSFTTLWLALNSIELNYRTANDRDILINGASGALGQMVTRILVSWGARVAAICSASNFETCRKNGASTVIDRLGASISAIPPNYDFVLNFGSWNDEEMLVTRLKKTGAGYATTCHPLLSNCDRDGLVWGAARSFLDYRRARRRMAATAPNALYRWTVFKPAPEALQALRSLLKARLIAPQIGLSAPIDEGAKAFAHVAAGRQGKAILRPLAG